MEFGDYRIEVVPDTEFRLDGGAMFGVVPRILWQRVCPPDELNRISLNMNCVFIETPDEKVIIETGIGEKWTEKEMSMYGIVRQKPFAQILRERTGFSVDDITIVVNTHLHFDHAGGNTIANGPQIKPQFRNARYFVSGSEFEHAEAPHERNKASYLPQNWRPLQVSGQLELKPDDYEVVEGLQMKTIKGHSPTMQTWRLDRGGKTLYGFADLIPTRHHVSLPWIMSYDLYPTETLEFKKRILPLAVKEAWLCLFYHDPEQPLCRLIHDDKGFQAVPIA
jgi:glyoxylase-like metal-dependent hydrolase (beta-lactamase superfamily II)